jgi:hypothetical protein
VLQHRRYVDWHFASNGSQKLASRASAGIARVCASVKRTSRGRPRGPRAVRLLSQYHVAGAKLRIRSAIITQAQPRKINSIPIARPINHNPDTGH